VVERSAHNRLVVGSNPTEPTKPPTFYPTDIDLLRLLELLLSPDMKRKLDLRNKTNSELFDLYDVELTFKNRSANGLREARRLLGHFQEFLCNDRPSLTRAKEFLRKYESRKTTTLARYVAVTNGFMKWYGEPLDIKIRLPKTLPEYVEPDDVDKLLTAMLGRRSHKRTAQRDILLVNLAVNTGLRRAELANLKVDDIDFGLKVLVVRQGKGSKDRVVPLTNQLVEKLKKFIAGKGKAERLLGLQATSISGKIRYWSRKAGVDIHTHSLRDRFATALSERGVPIRSIQELLGHDNLKNTERYTLLTSRHLRDAIDVLEKSGEAPPVNGKPIPPLPKLISTKPTKDIQITILDANKKYYMDDEGNTFEIE